MAQKKMELQERAAGVLSMANSLSAQGSVEAVFVRRAQPGEACSLCLGSSGGQGEGVFLCDCRVIAGTAHFHQ